MNVIPVTDDDTQSPCIPAKKYKRTFDDFITKYNDNRKKQNPINVILEKNTDRREFYVGKLKCETNIINTPLVQLTRMLSEAINKCVGLLYSNYQVINEIRVDHFKYQLMFTMFEHIVHENGALLPANVNLKFTSVEIHEPMVPIISSDGATLTVCFSETFIATYLEHTTMDVKLNFTPEFNAQNVYMTDTINSPVNDQVTPHTLGCSEMFIKLYIIADHAATHYIELYNNNKTDYIDHANFGKNVLSIHGQIKINTYVMTGASSAPTLFTNLHDDVADNSTSQLHKLSISSLANSSVADATSIFNSIY